MEELGSEVIVQFVALIAGVGVAVIATVQQLFKVVNVYIDSWIQKVKMKADIEMKQLEYQMRTKSLKLELHPFWNTLYNYLSTNLPYKVAHNDFKTKCARDFIEVTWLEYEKIMKEDLLVSPSFLGYDDNSLYNSLIKGYQKLISRRSAILKERGMNSKIIEVFERNRREEVNLILGLYKDIIASELYVNNVQKIWAILDLQNYLMVQMAESTWEDITNANGELRDLIYDNSTNTMPDYGH